MTDFDEATRGEEVVTEQDTGKIDEQAAGGSSDSNTEGLMNGGDTTGTGEIPETYTNDNEAWGGDDSPSDEAPTQTIEDERQTPEEIHERNNSEADQEATPDTSVEQGDQASGQLSDQDRANMMNDMF